MKENLLIKNIILNGEKKDVFIEGNLIKKIGNNLNFKVKKIINGKGEKAALPGLINCHTHSAMTLLRGYGDDLPLKQWLEKRIWPTEAKLTKEDIYWGTKLACLEMIKTGTTCFNDMYWHEESSIRAAEEMGVRAKIGLVLMDFLPMGKKEDVIKKWDYLKSKNFKTTTFSIAPHSIYGVSRDNLIWSKEFARSNKLILHIHVSETEKEVRDCYKKWKLSPVGYLDKLGILDEDTALVHAVWLSDNDMKIVQKRKSTLIFNPCSNLKLAVGDIFNYKSAKEKKINIALGTDGPASNNSLDLFGEMKTAALIQKQRENNPAIITAKEVFDLVTINGAKALKINSGEIKEGKLADIILVDLNKSFFCPGHNFYSDVVYAASGLSVSETICDGRILMTKGRVFGEKEIIKNTRKRAIRLVGNRHYCSEKIK